MTLLYVLLKSNSALRIKFTKTMNNYKKTSTKVAPEAENSHSVLFAEIMKKNKLLSNISLKLHPKLKKLEAQTKNRVSYI